MNEDVGKKDENVRKYLSVSVDVGYLLKISHKALIEGKDRANLYFNQNERYKQGLNKPLFRGKYGAVWLNKEIKDKKPSDEIEEMRIDE